VLKKRRLRHPSCTVVMYRRKLASPVHNVLRDAIYPMQWMGLMLICCGVALKRMGMLGVSVRKMKALTVKVEIVTLIGGKDR